MVKQPKPRLVWFDANRVCAAMGVVLIHCTTDFSGGVFPDATPQERMAPVFLRSVAEFSGSEMFFFFSLFLMSMRIDRNRPEYGPAMRDQARRLLVPFAFWTLFYAFFRLIKADAFGYAPQLWAQLSNPAVWMGYLILGKSQYHMHFLPTLFLIFLFYPVMRLALRFPILGISLFATLGMMHHVQDYIWSLGLEPGLREYLLRATKVLGYVGYGLAAFALYGLWRDGIPRGESRVIRRGAFYFAAMAYLATIPFFGAAVASGAWGVREGWSFYGHFLMPLLMFALFMGGQYRDWSPRWSWMAQYTFGVYLVHPLLIDLYDVIVVKAGIAALMSPWMVVTSRFAVVLPAALLLAVGLSRFQPLAWTIGLGPAPWEWGRQKVGRGA
ncbi:acyltransferase [Paracoccus sp. (in: a-proteobacteria)]|uniref:acyltransferase n=1 Tax=Paracoccus sp. TaxID=267 RepID=UPI00396C992D